MSGPACLPTASSRQHVALEVAFGVCRGLGRLAEHVVGEQIALLLKRLGAAQRLLDGAPQHELIAQDPHGLAQSLPDHRLAGAHHHALEQARRPLAMNITELDDLPRQHQPPGGGIDEQAVRAAQVLFPMAAADLFCNELVGCLGVRDPQQSLSEAHQDDALLAGQPVLEHECIDAGELMPPGTRRVDELAGEIGYASALVLSEDRTLDERPDEPGLLDEMIGRNFVAWRDDLRRVGAGTDGNELVGHGNLGLI